ncbi:hypothetical protein EBO15_03145 [Actinomadura harenae]|uniref:Uncharacterized protein n=1 Tax=Actinomadura harenae TaxID=2483351 RepID=A0A3M2MC84_9ACTN|nr:hypothetical protein EBO15_03145 [Actinomadura harenae]
MFSAYCLTLVRGIAPGEFMRRLGARVLRDAAPLDEWFVETSFDYWDTPHHGDVQFIGATTVPGDGGDWTLAFEVNGYLGVVPELMVPVSMGTRLVTHRYNNGNGHGDFMWIEDGDLRLDFEPLFAFQRSGSAPDGLLDEMREIGFDLDPETDEIGPSTSGAFALAERLTGVRVTEALVEGASFLCGEAAVVRGRE